MMTQDQYNQLRYLTNLFFDSLIEKINKNTDFYDKMVENDRFSVLRDISGRIYTRGLSFTDPVTVEKQKCGKSNYLVKAKIEGKEDKNYNVLLIGVDWKIIDETNRLDRKFIKFAPTLGDAIDIIRMRSL